MIRSIVFAATVCLGATNVQAADITVPAHEAQHIKQWRAARRKRLTAPDGWLSLVGLDWLEKGANSIGSAKDNDIVIATAPPHLGTVTWTPDGAVDIKLESGAQASISGQSGMRATLRDDSHENPTTVSFGTTSFYVIARNGRKGLRVKDTQSPTREHFTGLDYFPVDPSLRIVAKWVPFDPPRALQMGNEIGAVDSFPVPGKAVFQYHGHSYTLYPVIEEPGAKRYFLVFADATSGKETYGAARFVYIDKPHDGHVVIDFNKAYNPPCAFTPFATCPLAPPENRLGFRVTAGEKAYHGSD